MSNLEDFMTFIKESLERIESQGIDRDKEQRVRHERLEDKVDDRLKEQREDQQRFADQVDARFTEQKAERSRLESKMDTHFTKLYGRVGWIWGATAVIGAAFGVIATLLLKL